MSKISDLIIHLQRIEDLLSALVKKQFSDVLEKELSSENMQTIFAMTGEFTARQIHDKTGLSISNISRVWKRWENLGLIVKDAKRYRKVI